MRALPTHPFHLEEPSDSIRLDEVLVESQETESYVSNKKERHFLWPIQHDSVFPLRSLVKSTYVQSAMIRSEGRIRREESRIYPVHTSSTPHVSSDG